jgi:pyruvate,water dikinase
MNEQNQPIDNLLYDLKERAKELNCLYQIQELLNSPGIELDQICQGTVSAIPPGWQYPDVCRAEIILGKHTCQSPDFFETPWVQTSDIIVQDELVGRISVYYTEERPLAAEGPFLKEERKLIDTIAEQFGMYILHQRLKEVFEKHKETETEPKAEWWVIIDMLKRTDPKLLAQISRKMINYLCWAGVDEAQQLLEHFTPAYRRDRELLDVNQPLQIEDSDETLAVSDNVFKLASVHLNKETIFENIQQWIQEEQSGFLVNVLVNPSSSLRELCSAIERYHHLTPQGLELSHSREVSCRIALIRRLLSDQPEYVGVAKHYISVDDFNELIDHLIYPSDSHGKLGGKGAGLFLAKKILDVTKKDDDLLENVKTPKTWYVASDTIFHFMSYAKLDDIFDQKSYAFSRMK